MLRARPLVARAADLEFLTLHRVAAAERAALASRFGPDSGRVARELSLGGLPVDAARIRAPMLAVATTEDRFFTPAVARRLAARYDIPLRVYEGHAHFVVMEPGWERIAAELEAWLGENVVREEAGSRKQEAGNSEPNKRSAP
jgi:pimeloyl-ACP methyl ester carboxylesterase